MSILLNIQKVKNTVSTAADISVKNKYFFSSNCKIFSDSGTMCNLNIPLCNINLKTFYFLQIIKSYVSDEWKFMFFNFDPK